MMRNYILEAVALALMAVTIIGGSAQAQETAKINVIPQPVRATMGEGNFEITERTVINTSEATKDLADVLNEALEPALGFKLNVMPAESSVGPAIILALQPGAAGEMHSREEYRLEVKPEVITITAPEKAGLFYGIQTLRQLLPVEVFSQQKVEGVKWTVPAVSIHDWPRFEWRGLHLDVARHFMPKDFVKKYLDLMALHKLNMFHFHLTEDQGWRIEIKKYPKLTEVGAWRKETLIGKGGSKSGNRQFDGKPHGGFYTQDEIREIVAYAQERYITIVPEIEMPGHAQAAIAAYPEWGSTSQTLEVWTRWGVSKNVFNMQPETVQAMKDILQETMDLFPGPFIHIGGDEAPKDQWKASAQVQARMKELGIHDEEALQGWFTNEMDKLVRANGRRLIGWDEILEGGVNPSVAVMAWRGDGKKAALEAARKGHDVVVTPNETMYFDHYQSKTQAGEPLAIGGFTDIDEVYNYDPVLQELTPEETKHVLGVQGNVWTEYIPTTTHAEYMVYPRACALSEIAWTPLDRKDLEGFKERLATHAKRLEGLGVNYRPLEKP